MSRAQSPARGQSPLNTTTEELLARVLNQMEVMTISFNTLKKENENRIEEISRISQKLGGAGTVETDNEAKKHEITDDKSSDEEVEEPRWKPSKNENIYVQPQLTQFNQQPHSSQHTTFIPGAPYEERRMNAKLAIETIKTLNGQDDMGVEDFVKTIKKAKLQCSEPVILLDLILAKKIIGNAEKAIRYIPINSYEDLFIALRQNLKQTNSLVSLKSKLESCKQGMTETVQNFTLRFRQITNEIYYLVQSQHVNPTKRRLKIELEEEEAVNRYMLNLRREIGMQVRLLKPATISEAQSHAIETETWLKDSQPARQAIPKSPVRPWPRPVGPSRSNANTTPFAKNTQQPVKGPMNCHKCGKIGHFASQCFKQGFP